MELNIDYVSDLHLTHYISKNESITKIDKLVQDKISMQVKGNILVVAGDIDEDINRVSELLYSCSKYYKKVIFVLGNHEYYIPVIKYIYTDPMAKEYKYNSMNKVYRLNEIFKDNNDIIILDKTNNTKGLYTYNTFLLVGDTLWYKPVTLVDKLYNYPMQNDSRFILSELSKKDKIQKLHNDSISWYNNLPNNIDLIITHVPPFSLFREYVAQLVEYNKQFIIMGNTNALSYKEIFKLFKDDNIRTGYTNFNVGMYFYVPDDTEKYHKIENGKKMVRVATSCWFTNLPVKRHNEKLILYEAYSPEKYPKYENFDAINVDSYTKIPKDYDGYMGVPITFLDKYNPNQFKLLGLGISNSGLKIGVKPYKPEHKKYRKEIQHKGAVDGDLYMLDINGHPVVPYARIILIKDEVNE